MRLAIAALTLAVTASPSEAQRFDATSPVTGQPDNPGIGQDTAPNGLPALRRRIPDGLSRDNSRGSPGGDATSGEQTGGDSLRSPLSPPIPAQTQPGLSQLNTRVTTGGQRTGGSTTAPNNLAPTILLRSRAAPPRRIGSATRKVTQEVTQVPPPALRLTPIVRQAVVGVPVQPATGPVRPILPFLAISPALGLLTPGFILGTDLARPIPTDPAYAPLGYRIGTFTVLPSFAQSVGYDSNPDQTSRQLAKGSAALRTEAAVDFQSDWSSSSFQGALRGSYLETPQNEAASRPAADGTVRLRIDANRDLHIDAEGRFLVDTQRTSSPNLQAASATSRPLLAVYGASLGATETFNRLSVTLRGSVDRSEFDNARLSDGTIINQSDRNLNQYSLQLRTAYEITPDLSPFVDILGDTRVYDMRRDASGVRRDSDGIAFMLGASFGLARSVTGEISAGIQHRSYVDPTLRDINAPLVNAALVWSMSPLTTVRLTAATGVTETTVVGSSGILTDVATLEVQHDLLRNLSIVVGGSFLRNDYQGSTIRESGFSATARLDYRFTRWLTLRGTYIYQQIDSTVAGSSFRENTFLLGLRVNP
ncbi:outer membrane beta-barrel protein [Methylobacterium sp. NEAU K]|uniref:outer membrane beta-barrel protein n=1 Tax=Methylobacterium sp. NEAU K TaxID=3064946 RepID=UPI0027328FFB|nr:outer membrane beta-barrel protein [Methylobacterium sp. NEAU K]MDP4002266.1 outer membrane beta-barrel protein [Methylobacterium sp. NEAU K]